MNRPARMWIAILLFIACISDAGGADAVQPNIVLLLADDIGWTDYGFAGHPQIQTPALDRLAKESLVCSRGYVPTSLCRPSLMSLVTGLYPHQHLITGNDPPRGTSREMLLKHVDRTPTVPRLLSERGYLSFQSGKWWEGDFKRCGFTHGMTHGDPARGGRHGDDGLTIGRQGVQPVLDFIDSAGDRPFFVWYAPMLPHQPHNPPERLLRKYRDQVASSHVAKYYAMVEWFDETCGEILAHLDKKQLTSNTLVIYVADNGWIQQPDKPTFDPRSKRSRFDGGLRTQIALRWPGRIRLRLDHETPVTSLDLAPTMLAAAGVKTANELPGLNLLPDAIEGKLPEREAIFGELFEHDIADIDRAAPGLQYRWCLSGRWKLIVDVAEKQLELFDVVADPAEQHNLASQQPQRVAELKSKLDAWWRP